MQQQEKEECQCPQSCFRYVMRLKTVSKYYSWYEASY